MSDQIFVPGEGDTKLVERTRVRRECDQCGEPAMQRHTYLLDGARSNPLSRAYGKDDCSWSADREEYTCDECKRPAFAGHGWCSTFDARTPAMAHMFLRWDEREIEPQP